MRKWVLWIHMYGLLLCTGYLILFGVSSLLYNHPLGFTRPEPTVVKWEREVRVEALADKKAHAEAVIRQLGLFGWNIPWHTKYEPDGTFRIGLARPGKDYTIRVPVDGPTQVEEKRTGVWMIVRRLHGLMRVPNSVLAVIWGQYTRLTTILVLFASLSGVYLFATRKSERWVGWSLLAAATLTSGGMMAYVTFAG